MLAILEGQDWQINEGADDTEVRLTDDPAAND